MMMVVCPVLAEDISGKLHKSLFVKWLQIFNLSCRTDGEPASKGVKHPS
jgi:hypothetical protein